MTTKLGAKKYDKNYGGMLTLNHQSWATKDAWEKRTQPMTEVFTSDGRQMLRNWCKCQDEGEMFYFRVDKYDKNGAHLSSSHGWGCKSCRYITQSG